MWPSHVTPRGSEVLFVDFNDEPAEDQRYSQKQETQRDHDQHLTRIIRRLQQRPADERQHDQIKNLDEGVEGYLLSVSVRHLFSPLALAGLTTVYLQLAYAVG